MAPDSNGKPEHHTASVRFLRHAVRVWEIDPDAQARLAEANAKLKAFRAEERFPRYQRKSPSPSVDSGENHGGCEHVFYLGKWLRSGDLAVRCKPCGRRHCPYCGPKRALKDAQRYAQAFASAGVAVHRVDVTATQATSMSRYATKSDHWTLTVPLGDGRSVIYTTHATRTVLKLGLEISLDELTDELMHDLDDVPATKHEADPDTGQRARGAQYRVQRNKVMRRAMDEGKADVVSIDRDGEPPLTLTSKDIAAAKAHGLAEVTKSGSVKGIRRPVRYHDDVTACVWFCATFGLDVTDDLDDASDNTTMGATGTDGY